MPADPPADQSPAEIAAERSSSAGPTGAAAQEPAPATVTAVEDTEPEPPVKGRLVEADTQIQAPLDGVLGDADTQVQEPLDVREARADTEVQAPLDGVPGDADTQVQAPLDVQLVGAETQVQAPVDGVSDDADTVVQEPIRAGSARPARAELSADPATSLTVEDPPAVAAIEPISDQTTAVLLTSLAPTAGPTTGGPTTGGTATGGTATNGSAAGEVATSGSAAGVEQGAEPTPAGPASDDGDGTAAPSHWADTESVLVRLGLVDLIDGGDRSRPVAPERADPEPATPEPAGPEAAQTLTPDPAEVRPEDTVVPTFDARITQSLPVLRKAERGAGRPDRLARFGRLRRLRRLERPARPARPAAAPAPVDDPTSRATAQVGSPPPGARRPADHTGSGTAPAGASPGEEARIHVQPTSTDPSPFDERRRRQSSDPATSPDPVDRPEPIDRADSGRPRPRPGARGRPGGPSGPGKPRRPARPGRAGLVAAVVFVLVLLAAAAPAAVLAWRSALWADPGSSAAAGVIGGLLAIVGITLLALGGIPLVRALDLSGRPPAERPDQSDRPWTTALLRPPVFVTALGLLVLLCAAIAAG